MIATCTHCGVMFETTEEDACAPGTMCPECHKAREAEDRDDPHAELLQAAREYERLKCR